MQRRLNPDLTKGPYGQLSDTGSLLRDQILNTHLIVPFTSTAPLWAFVHAYCLSELCIQPAHMNTPTSVRQTPHTALSSGSNAMDSLARNSA